jgi:hypothetical protein
MRVHRRLPEIAAVMFKASLLLIPAPGLEDSAIINFWPLLEPYN